MNKLFLGKAETVGQLRACLECFKNEVPLMVRNAPLPTLNLTHVDGVAHIEVDMTIPEFTKELVIEKQIEQETCKWKRVESQSNMKFAKNPHTSIEWNLGIITYCPSCGKEIEVVE
jgi:hypothetical protein